MSGSMLPEPPAPRADSLPVTVHLQPEDQIVELPRHSVKTVQRLLEALHIRPCAAIVARGRELLTPDRKILPGDRLLVRKVASSG